MVKKLILILCIANVSTVFAQGLLQEKLDMRALKSSKKVDPKVAKVMKSSEQSLRDSKMSESFPKVGEKLNDIAINDRKLSEYLKDGPVVLKFYRGHWCPYCTIELKEYQNYDEQFKQAGASMIILTPDTPKQITKNKRKNDLTLNIYSDKNNQIAKELNLMFTLDDELVEVYKGFGINLEESQGNKKNQLPIAATIVIGKDRVVKYFFGDVDYKKRAEPTEVLKIVKGL